MEETVKGITAQTLGNWDAEIVSILITLQNDNKWLNGTIQQNSVRRDLPKARDEIIYTDSMVKLQHLLFNHPMES